jgi:dTDP-glucose 4,6-dehydratase
MTKVIVTGGAGFIASHLIGRMLKTTDWQIIVLDRFTYASHGLDRLKEVGAYDNPRVKIHVVDCAKPICKCLEKEIGAVDYIVHMAAATHVDNSIACPRDFIEANIFGTFEMLEFARRQPNLKVFYYQSTDEVFGPAPGGKKFEEWDRYNSTNPYSATKASGEELALAWANTYNVPVVISHMMNVFGTMQHREKFVPRVVRCLLQHTEIQIHADPNTGLSGTRNYLHCDDVSSAIMFLLERGSCRGKYNIAGDTEISNLNVAKEIARIMKATLQYRLVSPTDVRPGFDVRYGLNGDRMRSMGWHAPKSFIQNIESTIQWMTRPENLHWLGLKP